MVPTLNRQSNDKPSFSGPGSISNVPKPVQPVKEAPKKDFGYGNKDSDDIDDDIGEVNKASSSNYEDDFEASDAKTPAQKKEPPATFGVNSLASKVNPISSIATNSLAGTGN